MKTIIFISLIFFLYASGFVHFDHFHMHWPFSFQFENLWFEPIAKVMLVIAIVFAVVALCVFLAVGIAGITGALIL